MAETQSNQNAYTIEAKRDHALNQLNKVTSEIREGKLDEQISGMRAGLAGGELGEAAIKGGLLSVVDAAAEIRNEHVIDRLFDGFSEVYAKELFDLQNPTAKPTEEQERLLVEQIRATKDFLKESTARVQQNRGTAPTPK